MRATPKVQGSRPTSEGAPSEKLFDALRRGDNRALEELLPPLRERIARLAKERLGDAQTAQEVTQETLSAMWTKRESIRDPDHVLPFVFQTLRHKIGSCYLRTRREKLRVTGLQSHISATSPEAGNPERIAEARELERSITAAIEKCAVEHVMWGKILQLLRSGRTPQEIRSALGDVPMATIHTRIHRARARLIDILRDEFQVEL
jgi:RNA polymerase sigma-70 factor (ECF subfamily)